MMEGACRGSDNDRKGPIKGVLSLHTAYVKGVCTVKTVEGIIQKGPAEAGPFCNRRW